MKYLFIAALFFMRFLPAAPQNPQEALQMLIEGNARFSSDQSEHPDRTSERRLETVQLQTPFACIVGCSDSRVPLEIIFDQGIGDLFIVRVAGNVVGPLELDSVEYSVIYLKSKLILVLGHENCGAVAAVLAGQTKDIEDVAKLIQPAVNEAKGDLETAIKANVRKVVRQLQNTPVIKDYMSKGKVDVRGGYYNFHTGKVELL